MRITIITVGSRGDVQPYVALGAGLQRAGFRVRLATHANFETLARAHDLEFSVIEGNPRTLLETETAQAWLATGGNPFGFVRHLAELMQPMLVQGISDCWQGCDGADAIIYSSLGWLSAHHVVEKKRVPGIAAFLQPASPTKYFPASLFPPQLRLGPLYHRLSYTVGESFFWRLFRQPLNEARRAALELPPMPRHSPFAEARRKQWPVLYGYSPSVVPKPPDWGSWLHVTGYWFLDRPDEWQPPANLAEFIRGGPRPVYVGFGSMRTHDAGDITEVVLRALQRSGQRAVLLTGWGGLAATDLPEYVHAVESVPHDWLFPLMAAVIHHAGAGTTAAGLRAGVPTVAVPYFADQPFWGWRVQELGVGPRPIRKKRLAAENLAGAIRAVIDNNGMRRRAAEVGEQIRREDGIGRAVAVVKALLREA
jgi:UDP:flavonoid glycosyltransferase YjiC (YdhE family)